MKTIIVTSEQQLNKMVNRSISKGNFAQKINKEGKNGAKILDPHNKPICKIIVKQCGGL